MEGYRLWCKNKNEWERDNSWIGINGCLMTLHHGYPCPLNGDAHILQRSTGRRDISGREVFEGDFIESHQGTQVLDVLMVVKYGTYEAYCPSDDCYMDNVGFYVEAVGYPQMPLGPLENYAKVIGNIFENPDWLNQHFEISTEDELEKGWIDVNKIKPSCYAVLDGHEVPLTDTD